MHQSHRTYIGPKSVSSIRLTGCTIVSSGAVAAGFPEQAASKAAKQIKRIDFFMLLNL